MTTSDEWKVEWVDLDGIGHSASFATAGAAIALAGTLQQANICREIHLYNRIVTNWEEI